MSAKKIYFGVLVILAGLLAYGLGSRMVARYQMAQVEWEVAEVRRSIDEAIAESERTVGEARRILGVEDLASGQIENDDRERIPLPVLIDAISIKEARVKWPWKESDTAWALYNIYDDYIDGMEQAHPEEVRALLFEGNKVERILAMVSFYSVYEDMDKDKRSSMLESLVEALKRESGHEGFMNAMLESVSRLAQYPPALEGWEADALLRIYAILVEVMESRRSYPVELVSMMRWFHDQAGLDMDHRLLYDYIMDGSSEGWFGVESAINAAVRAPGSLAASVAQWILHEPDNRFPFALIYFCSFGRHARPHWEAVLRPHWDTLVGDDAQRDVIERCFINCGNNLDIENLDHFDDKFWNFWDGIRTDRRKLRELTLHRKAEYFRDE